MSPEMKKQIREICCIVIVLAVVQICVFFAIGRGSFGFGLLKAAIGTAAGCVIAMLNMVMLACGIERSVKKSEKKAQYSMGMGYILRLAVIALYVFAAIKLTAYMNLWAALIPLVFPRIAILIINFKNSGSKAQGGDGK